MVAKHIDFSKNLRSLCAETGSIADACREIGINRQQFNRYVTGASLPSAHNLHRIAVYFGISESDLFQNNAKLLADRRTHASGAVPEPLRLFTDAFRHQGALLRRYLGYYHGHFLTPSWDGYIYRSLIRLEEVDGFVVSKTVERAQAPDRSVRQRVIFDGLVALKGQRIYMVETERNIMEGSIAHTVLFPAHRHQIRYLRGQTAGVAWRPRTPSLCLKSNLETPAADGVCTRSAWQLWNLSNREPTYRPDSQKVSDCRWRGCDGRSFLSEWPSGHASDAAVWICHLAKMIWRKLSLYKQIAPAPKGREVRCDRGGDVTPSTTAP